VTEVVRIVFMATPISLQDLLLRVTGLNKAIDGFIADPPALRAISGGAR
jgi:hypothetical protein